MPIDGLTGTSRWPRLGVLRKGAAQREETRTDRSGKARAISIVGADLGEDLRFVGVDKSLQEAWGAAFGGDTVREIEVFLPYATVDEVWSAWREHWVAGGLRYRCDGREHVLWLDERTGEYMSDPRPCPGASCEAKQVGRLEVLVPALERLGVVTVTTTSIHDIQTIDGALRVLAGFVPDLRRVPLRLVRILRAISTPAKDSNGRPTRSRRKTWLLHLETHPQWTRALMRGQSPALARPGDPLELPPPADDDDVLELVAPEVVPEPAFENGFGQAIATAVSVAVLQEMWPAIEAIDQANYRANVLRLYWARLVELARVQALATADAEVVDGLLRVASAAPEATEGRDEALLTIEARRDDLRAALPARTA